jgi:hypothetical protein
MTTMQPAYRPSWAPANPKPPELSQTAPPTPFLESPVLAVITDVVVAASAAFYGWGLSLQKNKWSTLMYVISAASVMKLLHDLGRTEKR